MEIRCHTEKTSAILRHSIYLYFGNVKQNLPEGLPQAINIRTRYFLNTQDESVLR